MKVKISFRNLSIFMFLMLTVFYITYGYKSGEVYKKMNISAIGTSIVEYGSSKSEVLDVYENIDAKVISVEKDINTKKIGMQTAVLKIEKDNFQTNYQISIDVRDTVAPEIKFKQDVIEVDQGAAFDLNSNIVSIIDAVDGELKFLSKEKKNDLKNNYYTITSSINFDVAGSYAVNVDAIDRNGNKSTAYYTVVVRDTERSKRLVNIAYSLVGKAYVSGGVGPSSFDCSGLVQYIYRQIGISVSRSASTQINDGVSVSYDNIMPGDIISWGYANGVVTHSAIYVGNGKMVHAANVNQGVIVSDVLAWERGSNVTILGIRRI